MTTAHRRLVFIDALKAIASQLIVLHHLALYGPMSTMAHDLAPDVFEWLETYGRIAVQVFLVMGGFLAVKSLAPAGVFVGGNPLTLVWRRYLSLALPFAAALGLAILGAAVARAWMAHDSIPLAPTWPQFVSHVFLLHGLLGQESLSAGVWYVAIDFQLFALLCLTLWGAERLGLAQGIRRRAPLLVWALVAASLFVFNLDAGWDNWALYFFGAYGLGALAYWAAAPHRASGWLWLVAATGLAALLFDFRLRIAVALVTAVALGVSRRYGWLGRWPDVGVLAFLGKVSYSVFLVHFPVCLMVNAAFVWIAPGQAEGNALGVLLAWGASVAVGTAFYHLVEAPVRQWLARRPQALRQGAPARA